MNIKYLGHSCFILDINGTKIITDPFISPNELASSISIEEIKVDYILVSHGHMDHVADLEAIAKKNPKAEIISSFEIVTYYSEKGISGNSMNTGGRLKLPFGNVKCVNAIHSSVLPDGTYAANPVGFVLESQAGNLYFAGDTALTMDMKLIPEICPPLDMAILPIGDVFTMGVEDAIMAAQFVNCQNIIGCHFDTFPPIKLDKNKAISMFEKAGLKLNLLNIGEETSF